MVQYESDKEAKEKRHEDFAKNHYPHLLNKLDEMIKQNNGYIALGRVIVKVLNFEMV